jgi:hypothetical protein
VATRERLTTSADEGPAFRSFTDRRLLVRAELGHRGLRQVAALSHLPLSYSSGNAWAIRTRTRFSTRGLGSGASIGN